MLLSPKTPIRLGLFLCAFCIIVPLQFAQSHEQSDPPDTASVYTVTAEKNKEETQDTTLAKTVITSDDIKKSGKTSIIDILTDVPGITFRSYSGDAEAQVSMRGFGENSFGRVQVFVDGRRLNNPDMQGINWLSIPLASIERIEILDGPAAAQYGSGTAGGIINIVTKEPTDTFHASASLAGGSFYTGRALFDMSIAGESGGAVVSIDQYNTRGFRERSASRATNALASGYIDFSDRITFKPSLFFTDLFYQMPGGLTETQFREDPFQAVNRGDEARELDAGTTLILKWTLSDDLYIEIPADYTYRGIGTDTLSWGSYTDRYVHLAGLHPFVNWTMNINDLFRQIRISGGIDISASVLINHTFADQRRKTETNSFTVAQYQFAPFASATLSLPANCAVSLSARYDGAFLNAKNKDGSIDEGRYQDAFVYDASCSFQPTETLSFYIKGGSLFRYPFTDETTSLYGYGADSFNKDLKPETGYNLEIGSKVRIAEIFTARASGWYMPMNNEIIYNPASRKNENIGSSLRTGCTIDASIQPVTFMDIRGSFSYVWAVSTDASYPWKKIPLVPDIEAQAEIAFHIPGGVTAAANVSFTGSAYQGGDFANTQKKIEAYILPGILLSYSPPQLNGNLNVQLRISNLLDTRYAPYQYYSSYTGTTLYPAQGRSITVSVTYRH